MGCGSEWGATTSKIAKTSAEPSMQASEEETAVETTEQKTKRALVEVSFKQKTEKTGNQMNQTKKEKHAEWDELGEERVGEEEQEEPLIRAGHDV